MHGAGKPLEAALHTLHECKHDTAAALRLFRERYETALPYVASHSHFFHGRPATAYLTKVDKTELIGCYVNRWSEDEAAQFERGLFYHGKNFHFIAKHLLP